MKTCISDEDILISDDKSLLDVQIIHNFLTRCHWAKGITLEEVKKSIENSFCFGFFLSGKMIGFARVVSDKITFAYLLDVFILEEYRGQGFSMKLLDKVFNHSDLQEIKKWMLCTTDAHGVYEKFGFQVINDPHKVMIMKKK